MKKLMRGVSEQSVLPTSGTDLKVREQRTDRDVSPEELVVPEKCAHVLHAAFLLHAVTDVGLEPGAKLNTHKQRHASEISQHEEKHIYFSPRLSTQYCTTKSKEKKIANRIDK